MFISIIQAIAIIVIFYELYNLRETTRDLYEQIDEVMWKYLVDTKIKDLSAKYHKSIRLTHDKYIVDNHGVYTSKSLLVGGKEIASLTHYDYKTIYYSVDSMVKRYIDKERKQKDNG